MRYDLIVKEVSVEQLCFTDVVMVNGKFQEVMGFTNIDGKCTLYFSDGTCIDCYTGDKITIAEGYETGNSVYNNNMHVFDRDMFVKIFIDKFGDRFKDLYTFCQEGKQTDNFFMLYDSDSYYILEKYDLRLVYWYKHVGRCAETSFPENEYALKDFVNELYIDLYGE